MSQRISLGCGLGFLVSGLGAASTATAQTTWYVDGSAAGPAHNGQAWCTAFVHVQEALAVAVAGDEIRVANGAYFPDRGAGQTAGDRNATFRLRRGVALRGGYAGCGAADPNAHDFVSLETILSGDLNGDDGANFTNNVENAFHVVTNDDGLTTNSTVLDGFTIVGGNANGTPAAKTDQGSGIHNFNGVNPFTGKPLVQNCTLKNNWAGNHGAFNDHGGATLINCEFRDNHAGQWGGGLYIHDALPTIVTDCRFIHNDTDGTSGGGGGAVHEGQAVFTRCRFTENSSKNHGGGFYNHGGGAPTLIDCVFEGNSAPGTTPTSRSRGGGLYSQDGTLTLVRCTFQGNYVFTELELITTGGGGALYAINTTGTVTDCLFEANESTYAAGAVYLASASTMTFEDCRFVGNLGYYSGGIYGVSGTSSVIKRCEFRDNTVIYGGGIFALDSVTRISDSHFFNNSAGAGGAIVSVGSAPLNIANCTFIANEARDTGLNGGGAIEANTDFTTITNCVFIGNSAGNQGGAIQALARGVGKIHTIVGCTFAGNTAPNGRAVAVANPGAGQPGNLLIANSILHDGGSEIWFDPTVVVTSSVTYSLVQNGWPGAGNIAGDPLFADLDGLDNVPGTLDDQGRLSPGSPCLDAGDTAALLADALDLDGDGNMTEPTPIDASGNLRVIDDPTVFGTGVPSGFGPVVDIGALELGDCNQNGVFDLTDIANGTSEDCNANGLPDECETDCNLNAIADECDVAAGASPDCNLNQIPDECEADCNANAIADECEIANCPISALFICGDCDADGVPNECDDSAPCQPSPPVGPFNRYISFLLPGNGVVEAFRVDKLDSGPLGGPAGSCWIDVPNAEGVAKCASAPVFRIWNESGVYVGDCEIVPAAQYEIRETTDGEFFSPPVTVSTIAVPILNGKKWGDVVGPFTGLWPPADLLTNVNDLLAVLAYINNTLTKPHITVVNIADSNTGSGCLPAQVNVGDVQSMVAAIASKSYGPPDFPQRPIDPALCPPCP